MLLLQPILFPMEDSAQPQLSALNLTTGLWVVVKYAGEEFPGEVTCIEDSDVEVNVMHRSANTWKWPRPEDKIFYSRNNVVRVMQAMRIVCVWYMFMFTSTCTCFV